jgi:hypothetical protein
MSEAETSGGRSASEGGQVGPASGQVGPGAGQRPPRPAPPPPRETNDLLVNGVITACWAVALVVLVIVRNTLPPGSRWWVWTCAAGFGLGLFGLWYVPMLKRSRARAAGGRSGGKVSGSQASGPRASGSQASGSQASGSQTSEPGSGYESRDSASKTVSSTDTPGNSTRS